MSLRILWAFSKPRLLDIWSRSPPLVWQAVLGYDVSLAANVRAQLEVPIAGISVPRSESKEAAHCYSHPVLLF